MAIHVENLNECESENFSHFYFRKLCIKAHEREKALQLTRHILTLLKKEEEEEEK